MINFKNSRQRPTTVDEKPAEEFSLLSALALQTMEFLIKSNKRNVDNAKFTQSCLNVCLQGNKDADCEIHHATKSLNFPHENTSLVNENVFPSRKEIFIGRSLIYDKLSQVFSLRSRKL
jgi:hypothetical protein